MNQQTKFCIWWTPQVPMKAFVWPVATFEEGEALCEVLARYDAFQSENRVKPNYHNAGGVMFNDPEHTRGDWHNLDREAAFDLGFVDSADEPEWPVETEE